MHTSCLPGARLFVDDANLDLIRYWLDRGASGVTTNPSIVAAAFAQADRQGLMNQVRERLGEIAELVKPHPLSIQVTAMTHEAMVAQAHEYRQLGDNVVVKVPYSYEAGQDNLPTIVALHEAGIPVNATCLMTTQQMMLAAMAGARYVSLFAGRVWEAEADPLLMIDNMRGFIDREELGIEIIVGSIRESDQVTRCWEAGAHIVTVPKAVLSKLGQNPSSVAAAQEMIRNAQAVGLT